MRLYNENLRSALLDSAKEAFLKHGFAKAQLREIASAAGATTGAVYKYFKDKEAIFDALVCDAADRLMDDYKKAQTDFAELDFSQKLPALTKIADNRQGSMIDTLYDNYDAFRLIACCSQGTKYEDYIDGLIQIEVDSSVAFLREMDKAGVPHRPIDKELIHIVASALFYGMFETLRHEMPRQKALVYMESLADFYSAGWFKILGLPS